MNNCIRNFTSNQLFSFNKRFICSSKVLYRFWERDPKAGYSDNTIQPKFTDTLKIGFSELKKEIALWKQEVREQFENDPILTYRPGEVDAILRFQDPSALDNWITTSDKDHNEGFSKCSLTITKHGKGLFSGYLSLQVPKDGKVKRSGYCNMKTIQPRKSFKRETYLNWAPYNMLVMKIRGDGHSYMLNLHSKGYFDITWNDMYQYVLFTRGGPYWQIVKIPFSKFFYSSKGRIQDKQLPVRLDKITSFGITAAQRYEGEFYLEIDYIGLEYDPTYSEECAYETYAVY